MRRSAYKCTPRAARPRLGWVARVASLPLAGLDRDARCALAARKAAVLGGVQHVRPCAAIGPRMKAAGLPPACRLWLGPELVRVEANFGLYSLAPCFSRLFGDKRYTLFGLLLNLCGEQHGYGLCNAYMLCFYVIKFLIVCAIECPPAPSMRRMRWLGVGSGLTSRVVVLWGMCTASASSLR